MSDRMFEAFEAAFEVTSRAPCSNGKPASAGLPALEHLFVRWEGSTFSRGLYRIHTAASAQAAKTLMHEAFIGVGPETYPFAFDWQGRQFAWHTDLQVVAIYEPALGEVFDTEMSLEQFHNHGLIDEAEATTSRSEFEEWFASPMGQDVPFDKCLGYKVPLFLGGEEDLSNRELADIEVYWSLTAQLRMGVE